MRFLLACYTSMTYYCDMEIVEATPFARRRDALFDEDQFLAFEQHLALNPTAGSVIPGGAGLRKIRWSGSGRGKRGGVRVIYYIRSETNRLFLIFGYRKNECEDLTKAQIKSLAAIIESL
jgi:mRNA-degrading endonuclease RelE of RelBE toxin-antitoxin system